MSELWKEIAGHPAYMVSNMGRVKLSKSGKILKPWATRHGYMQVGLYGRKRVYVHRIVAAAWCDASLDSHQVNHIDGNKVNNAAGNLEWVTQSQNQRHRFTHLGHRGPDLGKFGESHRTSRPVIATNLKTGESFRYGAAMDAVRAGFDSGAISRCCSGQYKSHRGFSWRFA